MTNSRRRAPRGAHDEPAPEGTEVNPGVRRSMLSNRRRDTSPELRLRAALHATGRRFRVDHRIIIDGARCRPDIVFTRARVAVFVDGCFWHGCPLHGHPPKSNTSYWLPKIARTRERDRRDTALLEGAGWAVVRLWEHESLSEALAEVEAALQNR